MERTREVYKTLIVAIEQWIALMIGITCFAVFLWAALEGHKEFALQQFSHLGSNAVAAIGWCLTITVGVLGVALMRSAFSGASGLEAAAGSAQREVKTTRSDSARTAN